MMLRSGESLEDDVVVGSLWMVMDRYGSLWMLWMAMDGYGQF